MSAGKNNNEGKPDSRNGWRFIPKRSKKAEDSAEDLEDLSEEELDALLEADLQALISENPELVEDTFEALNEWREAFIEDNGREPTEEDFAQYLDLMTLDDDDWEEILESIDDPELTAFLNNDEEDGEKNESP